MIAEYEAKIAALERKVDMGLAELKDYGRSEDRDRDEVFRKIIIRMADSGR